MGSLRVLFRIEGRRCNHFNIIFINSAKLLVPENPSESAKKFHTLHDNVAFKMLSNGVNYYDNNSFRIIRWNFQESIRSKTQRFLIWPFPEKLPFTWNRPQKGTHTEKEFTGDLTHDLPSFSPSTPKPGFELSEELETASDDVKKIFSLATATKREINQLIKEATVAKFQRHAFDDDSPEARVALLTAKIRILVDHFKKFPTDSHAKVVLIKNIGTRKRLLRQLRQWDYQRFEWLLKELNITYKIPPTGNLPKITRKGEIRRLTREYCEKVRNDRLAAYHEKLKEQQKAFIKEKEDTLRWIAEEEKKLGNSSSVKVS